MPVLHSVGRYRNNILENSLWKPGGRKNLSLKEQKYSVLIVSSSKSFDSILSSLLPESGFYPIVTVSGVSAAQRTVAARAFDFVIINSPLPDEFGAEFAIDACSAKETVVLLFVKSEIYDETHSKVVKHGVFTLPKPTSRQAVIQALDWMASARERLRKIRTKTLSVEEKMTEIRLVNRAKWLLISELNMDEPHAHRYIEKQAMDMCITKRQAAENIIKTYGVPSGCQESL